jgi:hypothetical protein
MFIEFLFNRIDISKALLTHIFLKDIQMYHKFIFWSLVFRVFLLQNVHNNPTKCTIFILVFKLKTYWILVTIMGIFIYLATHYKIVFSFKIIYVSPTCFGVSFAIIRKFVVENQILLCVGSFVFGLAVVVVSVLFFCCVPDWFMITFFMCCVFYCLVVWMVYDYVFYVLCSTVLLCEWFMIMFFMCCVFYCLVVWMVYNYVLFTYWLTFMLLCFLSSLLC